MATEYKTKEERLTESMNVLKELRGLGIPLTCPEVTKFRERLSAYVNDEIPWEGTIDFGEYGRKMEVKLPLRADRTIEVLLRSTKKRR